MSRHFAAEKQRSRESREQRAECRVQSDVGLTENKLTGRDANRFSIKSYLLYTEMANSAPKKLPSGNDPCLADIRTLSGLKYTGVLVTALGRIHLQKTMYDETQTAQNFKQTTKHVLDRGAHILVIFWHEVLYVV